MPEDKKTKKSTKQDTHIIEWASQIEQLEKKLTEQEEITKRAQSDYFRLKLDMDGYMARAEEAKKTEKVDALVSIGSKMLPFLTQLEQSIAHLPEALAEDPRTDGLRLMYHKALQDIAQLGIMPISAEQGTDPDLTLHIPINMQDTDDETLKGKIVQVVASGRKYEKDGHTQVISPSQIIVGT